MFWIRISVANRMATDGRTWNVVMGNLNSGTYNNQYMIVDYKLFDPTSPNLASGLLWVGEQVPGYYVFADQTSVLATTGFWASYNIPFYPFIYNISDYPQYEKMFGPEYSYTECARAKIFHRDAPNVESFNDFHHVMRFNQYQTDALSQEDACKSISARCDLNAPWATETLNPYSAFGAIDCKATSDVWAPTRTSLATSGPTWDAQAPFAWTEQWTGVPHYGQPRVFAFDPVLMSPMLDRLEAPSTDDYR